MTTILSVVSSGALTAVGLSNAQTCAAVRAGISAYAKSGFVLQGSNWEPIMAATVPLRPRPSDSTPSGRLTAMARIALKECVSKASIEPSRTVLLLGIPEPDRLERFRRWFDDDVQSALQRTVLPDFHPESKILPYGNASTFIGLRKAREMLAAGVVDVCFVGGVDSFLNTADMDRMEQTWRLHREGVSQGLVPGEAAAFIAVTRADGHVAEPGSAGIIGIGVDRENADTTVVSDGHPTGHGLERALSAAVIDGGISESAIGLRVTDLNGERYGAMDSMLALSRFYRTDRNGLPLWHPAECFGETGAAVGALLIQIASHALEFSYSPARAVMCETSSDGGHRGACVVHSLVSD